MYKKLLALFLTALVVLVGTGVSAESFTEDLQRSASLIAYNGQDTFFWAKDGTGWGLVTGEGYAAGNKEPLLRIGGDPYKVHYANDSSVYYSVYSAEIECTVKEFTRPAIELWRMDLSTGETEQIAGDVLYDSFVVINEDAIVYNLVSDPAALIYLSFEQNTHAEIARFEDSSIFNARLAGDGRMYVYVYNRGDNMLELWQIGRRITKLPDPDIEVFAGAILGDSFVYRGQEKDGPVYIAPLSAPDQGELAPSATRIQTAYHGRYYDGEMLDDNETMVITQTDPMTGATQEFGYVGTPDFYFYEILGDNLAVLDGEGQVHLVSLEDFNQSEVIATTSPKTLFSQCVWQWALPIDDNVYFFGREKKLTDEETYCAPEYVKVLPLDSTDIFSIQNFQRDSVATPEPPVDETTQAPVDDVFTLRRHGGFGN